jgi:hypothetical protein
VYLLVFHAYINEFHGSRSKIPSKNISSGSVALRDLIPALKGEFTVPLWTPTHTVVFVVGFIDTKQGVCQLGATF